MTTPTADGGSTAPNILVIAPPFRDGVDEACRTLLEPATDGGRAIFVAYRQSPTERLAVCDGQATAEATDRVVVDVDVTTRSAAAATGDGLETPPNVEVRSVPDDLVAIQAALEASLEAATPAGTETVLCFHSLTDLLGQFETGDVISFLDAVTTAVADADAKAHYHLDPMAHDSETIWTLEELFDASIGGPDDDVADG